MKTDLPTPELALAQSGWLRALVRSLLRDEHDVDDVLQETWVAVLSSPPRSARGLRPWLARVARNFALRSLLAEESRQRRERAVAKPELQPSTEEIVGQVAVQRAVVDAVLGMDEPYRSVVLLRFWENLPPREVAQRLRVPVATVRTRLRRAIESLRERLDREHGGRRSWSAVLAPFAAAGGAPVGSLALVAAGALLMSLKLKVGVAVIAAALVAMAVWLWDPAEWRGPTERTPQDVAGAASPLVTEPETRGAAAPVARTPIESAPAPPPGRTPAVVGKLTDATTGEPLAAARITLIHRFFLRGMEPEPGAASGADGAFRIEADHTDPKCPPDFMVETPDRARLVGSISACEGRRIRGEVLDLGTISVPRGARVRGHVLFAADRRPVAGAKLFLLEEAQRNDHGVDFVTHGRAMGSTANDGSFELAERAPHAEAKGHFLIAVSDRGAGWTELRVAQRDLVDGIALLVEPAAELAVSVEDELGRPVAGAGVCAWPRYEPFWESDRRDPYEPAWLLGPAELVGLFAAITDGAGHATLSRLPRPPGLGERGAPYALVAGKRGFALTRPERLVVNAANDRITLKLRAFALFALAGTVRTPEGSPVAGATVRAVDEVTRTDAAGNYQVSGPSCGDGFVYVEAQATGHSLVRKKLSVPLAEPRLDLVLERLTPISGCVIDDAGLPVEDAGVGGLARKDRYVSPDRERLGEDGGFVFSEATAGEWKLNVNVPPGFERPRPDPVVRGGDRDVRVVLRRTPRGNASLVAEIVGPTGAALDADTASVFMPSGSGSVKTSRPPGRVLADGLMPGAWRIVVVAGPQRIEQDFTVRPDDTEVRIRLAPRRPGVLTGRILFDDVAGVQLPRRVGIRLLPSDAGVWCTEPGAPAVNVGRGTASVDPAGDGSFRFEDIPTAEPVRVQLWGDAMLAGEAAVIVPVGKEAHVEIRAQPGGEVVFRMPAASLYAWGEVSVRRKDGSWTDSLSSRIAGSRATTKLRLPAGENEWKARLYPTNEEWQLKPPRALARKVVVVMGSSVEVVLD